MDFSWECNYQYLDAADTWCHPRTRLPPLPICDRENSRHARINGHRQLHPQPIRDSDGHATMIRSWSGNPPHHRIISGRLDCLGCAAPGQTRCTANGGRLVRSTIRQPSIIYYLPCHLSSSTCCQAFAFVLDVMVAITMHKDFLI